MFRTYGRFVILFGILTVFAAVSLNAASDPFGETDRIYLDSVSGRPGEQVIVGVNLTNDEYLSSLSVPLTYDTSILTLNEISFTGSRVESFDTKITNPDSAGKIHGHFVVAVIRLFEDPIPPGDGLIFSLRFTLKPALVPGTVTTIDSLFYPPGGELVLSEDSTSAQIRPDFTAGRVSVASLNRAPSFSGLSNQVTLEGDSLILDVSTTDLDGDNVSLAVTAKPLGAMFVNNGDGTGTLKWRPEFVGPYSAEGSPFTVSFWASDGNLSVEKSILVDVVNINRRPVVNAPDSVAIQAGDSLKLNVSAIDPDYENVAWSLAGGWANASFDGYNPGTYNWQAAITDSGSTDVMFIATDPLGASDTASVTVRVQPATLYSMAIDTVSADLGARTTVNIDLENAVQVNGFDLLVYYDPSVLLLDSVSKQGTRAEACSRFDVTKNFGGKAGEVRIIATGIIPSGDGPVARAHFRVSNDIAFEGSSAPIFFEFTQPTVDPVNVLLDSLGAIIDSSQIAYTNGRVTVKSIGTIKIGDINLNGIAYDIGDAIRFTNFFINPQLYPFTLLQYANSDVNRDGYAATVADLVMLINIIVNGRTPSPKVGDADLTVAVSEERDGTGLGLSYESDFDIGAALVALRTAGPVSDAAISLVDNDMTLLTYHDGERLNLLIYSMDGEVLPAGTHSLVRIDTDVEMTVDSVALASADGQDATVVSRTAVTLPTEYQLYQNYPNPFNPETRIDFELPVTSDVRVEVINVLGQVVRVLQDGSMTAGRHTLSWQGDDDYGRSVSSGVYFYRLEAGGVSLSRKMMLLK